MYPLLIMLLIVVALFIKELLKKGNHKKTVSLIASTSLFAIAWGFLGQIIGLMAAFDAIEAAGDISASVLAGGLKISFLAPIFGMLIFLIGRLELIILTWIHPA